MAVDYNETQGLEQHSIGLERMDGRYFVIWINKPETGRTSMILTTENLRAIRRWINQHVDKEQ